MAGKHFYGYISKLQVILREILLHVRNLNLAAPYLILIISVTS